MGMMCREKGEISSTGKSRTQHFDLTDNSLGIALAWLGYSISRKYVGSGI